jgi:ubiquinone/menaquinone biosynthesis C-methylase UbiE
MGYRGGGVVLANRFSERSREPEWIDGADYTREEFRDCLSDLRHINQLLGGQRALARHLFPMIEATGRKHIRLLDIGTGSADLPRMVVEWARRNGKRVDFVVVDLHPLAVREARDWVVDYPEILVVQADAFHLPFVEGGFDFVMASLFLHHFVDEAAAELLRRFSRVARGAFLINDLRRHPLAYYSIRCLTWIFTMNRLVRHDAAVSVLRGFQEADWRKIAGLAGLSIAVHRHFPFRYLIIGEATGRDAGVEKTA